MIISCPKLCLLFFAAGLLLPSGTAWARFDLSPYLSITEEYTDNLFLSESDEKDDWISTVQPGFALLYDAKTIEAEIDYSLRFRYYDEYSDGNVTDLRDVQRSAAHALLFPEGDFTVAADAEITRVTVDERGADVEESELINTTNLYRAQVNPQYRWSPSPGFTATVGYRYDVSDYESDEGDDTLDHVYSLVIAKQLSAQTDVYAEYAFVDHFSDEFEDYQEDDYSLGLTQRLGPRLTLDLKGGLVQRDTDGAQDEWNTWGGRMEYLFSEQFSVNASYDDELAVSVSRGQIKRERATVRFVYSGRLTAEVGSFWSREDYLEEQLLDRRLGGHVEVTVPFGSRYTVNAFCQIERSRFTPDSEDMDRFAMGTSLGYSFNWMEISVGYTLRDRDSTIDINDYRVNRIILQANLRY